MAPVNPLGANRIVAHNSSCEIGDGCDHCMLAPIHPPSIQVYTELQGVWTGDHFQRVPATRVDKKGPGVSIRWHRLILQGPNRWDLPLFCWSILSLCLDRSLHDFSVFLSDSATTGKS